MRATDSVQGGAGRAYTVRGQLMLVVLATTGIALAIAATGLLVTDFRATRAGWRDDLAAQAEILALATGPALSFDDRQSASRNLAALRARPSIAAAAIYLPDGTLYAGYERDSAAGALPQRQPEMGNGVRVVGEHVELLRTVVQNGENLGAIYLRASYDIVDRELAYLQVLVPVMLMAMGIALLASRWLQRSISEPMGAMAEISRKIVEQRDYSLRARTSRAGEIGLVVDAFNNMLDEVQSRTRDLEQANAALRSEGAVRLEAERAVAASEKLYRAIGESIEYGVWICDPDGRCTYASDSFLALTGLTQEECSSMGWIDRLHPDERDATARAWLDCVTAGTPWYREHRILGTDGQYHHVLAQGVPIRDEGGAIVRWAGINLDIRRLKQTEDALREADRRKDDFVATLAHELRNPLQPIRNAVRILDLPQSDERQRRASREVLARQVQHMTLLLDDLLDVSRITRGKMHLKRRIVDLQSVVDAAVETARPLIDQKHHSLRIDMPPAPVILHADPLRLSQILGNLLTNAAKYTDRGGVITLRAALAEDGLTLAVSDTGIGLDPEGIPRLFTLFSQVDSAISRAEGGLGIGLALVKGLVALHEGSVTATSAGLGHGSEFLVRLPRTIVLPSGAAAAGHGSQPAANGVQHQGTTVLIADDNRDAADSLAAILRLQGYQVTTAYSGSQALEIAQRDRPAAILLDIGMPGMNGYEVCRALRSRPWAEPVVIVALTGWGQEEDKKAARHAGFDDHLTKPVDPDHLQTLLEKLL